jgi:hypothetical protein
MDNQCGEGTLCVKSSEAGKRNAGVVAREQASNMISRFGKPVRRIDDGSWKMVDLQFVVPSCDVGAIVPASGFQRSIQINYLQLSRFGTCNLCALARRKVAIRGVEDGMVDEVRQ